MPPRSARQKISACLLVILILASILLAAVIFVPKIISARANSNFGDCSPQLGTNRCLYLSILLLLQSDALTQPVDPNGSEVAITIDQGESVPSIINQLWESGLITKPGAFRSYLQYTGLDTGLKAGDYQLSPAMTPIEIAKKMQVSISEDIILSILPGWRAEEIANLLASSGFSITPAEFLSTVHTPPAGYSFSSCLSQDSLEGFLFPGSYTLPRQATITDLLSQVLANFESQVTNEMRNGFTNQGLDICQAVTLASIVQREAMVTEEMPMIASVFYNRLNAGSILASDPTVQYALGFNSSQATWWTNPLSLQDLQVDSAYNTYVHSGLPPAPISNPGLSALKAVAFPAQTPYYYFRSACDGSGRHVFAETFDEHVANECP